MGDDFIEWGTTIKYSFFLQYLAGSCAPVPNLDTFSATAHKSKKLTSRPARPFLSSIFESVAATILQKFPYCGGVATSEISTFGAFFPSLTATAQVTSRSVHTVNVANTALLLKG